jgi:hypothetical protein
MRWLAAIIVVVWLGGCATSSPPPLTASVEELRDTPFFAQDDLQCGPAVLATLLTQAGLPASPQSLADEVYLPARGGSLQIEMLATARRHGGFAVPVRGTLDALADELRFGHPVAVLLNLSLPVAPLWHYAVVVGIEDGGARVVLRSGNTQRLLLSGYTFEQTWARSGHWAFVAPAAGTLPAGADETTLLSAALAFERAAPPALTAKVYAALLARYPANLTAAMGLGNSRAAAGDTAGALLAFEDAALRFDSAPAWINLAQLRLDAGDVKGASDAAVRALQRSRADEPRWRIEAEAVAVAVRGAALLSH